MQGAWSVHETVLEIASVLKALLFELVTAITMRFLLVLCLIICPLPDILVFVLKRIRLLRCSSLVHLIGPYILRAFQSEKVVLCHLRQLFIALSGVVLTLRGWSKQLLRPNAVQSCLGLNHVWWDDCLLRAHFLEHSRRFVYVVAFGRRGFMWTHV